MPDCTYCGDSFDDEEAYLQHLHADHDGSELSRIDQRRVDEAVDTGGGGGLPTGPVLLGLLIVGTLGVTVYVTFVMGGPTGSGAGAGTAAAVPSESAQTPSAVGSVHEHGTIEVVIDGQELDFSRAEFQNPREYSAFHFEGGNGDIWHKHAQGVTLEYAMATLGIGVNETAVSYDGEVYRDGDPGTSVVVEVNGEPVDPQTYTLQGAQSETNLDGADHIRIVVRTEN